MCEGGKLASSKEAGIERRLVSIKPSLQARISWHDLLQVAPKLFAPVARETESVFVMSMSVARLAPLGQAGLATVQN
jgi:hypothetical protein